MYAKLDDGTWSYRYQCHYYYKGIVERVEPPVDESKIEQYFKEVGVKYRIGTEHILELPEVEPYVSEVGDGDYIIE